MFSTLHGTVVCIAEIDTDEYEVRFVVTKSSGAFAVPVGSYASLFVIDSDPVDMGDENFSDPATTECGVVGGTAHEPIVNGNVTVHR